VPRTRANSQLPTLLADRSSGKEIAGAQAAWRDVMATAVRLGIPVPGFSAALAYYDALRAQRLPAALVQGLRDFFGAHTYRRTDSDGAFHTLWAGDRSEVSVKSQPTRTSGQRPANPTRPQTQEHQLAGAPAIVYHESGIS